MSFETGSKPIQVMYSRNSTGPLCTCNMPKKAGAMQPARLQLDQLKDQVNITQGQAWEHYNTSSLLRLCFRQGG